ncbi:SGNH/GDSL hydrolase family protein [Myxococcus sp. Y35]|uniref:SGNH/GDSL hydrolase family protein n=1 Tax=Pseudomyxococcus flavus TaxID=3115648 RepID=UPI003CF5D4CB
MTHLEVGRGGRRTWFPVLLGGLLTACDIGSPPRATTPPPALPVRTEPAAPSVPVPTPEPEPAFRRVMPPRPERTGAVQAQAEKLGAPGARVEDPCLVPAGNGCARTALTPFFTSLDALASGTASGPVVIEAFGNSLIAGDRIVDVLRDDLSAAYGSAGRGVLLVDRMAPYGGRGRTSASSSGWQPRTLGELRAPPLPFGITGVYHVATRAKARSRFKLEGESRGTLWWLDVPEAGALTVMSEGQVLARTEPVGDGTSRATHFELPEGARTLDVVAERQGAVVQGVVLQHARPGIVLDTLGVPSSDAALYARVDDAALASQLAERAPRLLLFFLGGNESKRIEWKRLDMEKLRADLRALLRRMREAAPESACMLVGPMDAVRGPGAKAQALTQRPSLEAVNAAEREVALAEGCAFFDFYAAMGGKGALARFHAAGFMHDDLVHPRGAGLDVLGHLVTDALLRAYVETPPPARGVAALTPAKVDADEPTAEVTP